jgi:membrane-associated phospholipid phosphatase
MKRSSIAAACLLLTLGTALRASADVVTSWNSAALAAIRASSTPPPTASRALAILHVSIYDAVNGISRRHEPYLVESTVPASASEVAAASAAALRVLNTLFPAQTSQFTTLHQTIVQAIKDGPQKQAGLTWGGLVADRILASRANDGSGAAVPPPGGTGPGVWEPTPPAFAPYLLAQWGFVAPFVMESSDALRPNGPPPLDSARWAADYNEVKALGVAIGSTRTADQSQIARFWADGAGTETPPGHWNHIAQDVAAAQRNTLEQNARMFALLNLAMADAAICAWDAKYTFNFWRPVTAIRAGDTDGNDATDADPAWSSFITTPPFPDYISGHSTFSGAAARVLARFYGRDDVAFVTGSDALPGVTRSFAGFAAAAAEAGVSRIYGGIHYASANQDGLAAGAAIGEFTFANFLQPKGNRSRR